MSQPFWQQIPDLATREAVRKLVEDLQRKIAALESRVAAIEKRS